MTEVIGLEESRELTLLPEVVIPEHLQLERRRSVEALLKNPPKVDIMYVPDRSGTIAAIGLYDDPEVKASGLPRLEPIAGLGNEVYHLFCRDMHNMGVYGLSQGIGTDGSDEVLARFAQWVHETDDPLVVGLVAQLQQTIGAATSCAILDDIMFLGVVSRGIAPTVFKEAFGDKVSYDRKNNRFLFTSADWFRQILRVTFQNDFPALTPRQLAFFEEVGKGRSDQHYFSDRLQPHTMESLREVARYYGVVSMFGNRTEAIENESLEWIVEKYGENLLNLHQYIIDKMRLQMQEILPK